jgi:F-type H+-transporting ATPase subunit b
LKYLNLQARFSHRALSFAFLAVLVASVVAAPYRLAAQQSAPAAQTQPAAESQVPEKPEPAKEEGENRFRYTPTVQAAAKVLHLSVETTARTFEFINFAIIALAIGIPLFRFLPRFLRKRGEKLRSDIESARKVTEDANSRLSAVEAKLSSLGEEIARFRAEVEAESLQDEARIKAALADESARIVVAAEQEIGVAAAQAKRGLRHFAADLAIEQAAKQLVLTPETDRALIAEFVGDVSRNGTTKGGQN